MGGEASAAKIHQAIPIVTRASVSSAPPLDDVAAATNSDEANSSVRRGTYWGSFAGDDGGGGTTQAQKWEEHQQGSQSSGYPSPYSPKNTNMQDSGMQTVMEEDADAFGVNHEAQTGSGLSGVAGPSGAPLQMQRVSSIGSDVACLGPGTVPPGSIDHPSTKSLFSSPSGAAFHASSYMGSVTSLHPSPSGRTVRVEVLSASEVDLKNAPSWRKLPQYMRRSRDEQYLIHATHFFPEMPTGPPSNVR